MGIDSYVAKYEAPGLIINISDGMYSGDVGDGKSVVVSGRPGTLAKGHRGQPASGADSLRYFAGLHVPDPSDSRFGLVIRVRCKSKGEQEQAVRLLRSVELRKQPTR